MAETLFTQVQFTLNGLMTQVRLGQIGLPDIQRPFVWKNTKVRDLFDSMYRGFPVGYLLFWENGFTDTQRVIGADDKQVVPQLLVVDDARRWLPDSRELPQGTARCERRSGEGCGRRVRTPRRLSRTERRNLACCRRRRQRPHRQREAGGGTR